MFLIALVLILFFVFSGTVSAVLPITLASSLSADAVQAKNTQTPIVIFTTASDCEYCEVLRENVFQFLPNDRRLILREVIMDSTTTFESFNNESLTYSQFAERHEVDFSPTVLFLSDEGHEIAAPLVGVLTLDYYRYYFDKAVTIATKALTSDL
ncbi:MAG: thioredoxin-related protein [Gammaproteobacteria bacterium]